MTESPREIVLGKAQALLAQMTGTRYWGGSYPNPPTVEVVGRNEYEVTQFPYLGLLEAEGSRLLPDRQEADKDQFRIDVYGYTTGDSVQTPRLWAGRLRRDTMLTLRRAARGNLLQPAYWIAFGEEPEYLEFTDALAMFILPCVAHIMDSVE